MKRLDRLKGAFLGLMAHKLKTPLTSLSLGLEELERYAANLNSSDPCHQRLNSMREDMAQFSRMLASLLRIQQTMTKPEQVRYRCDLAEVVKTSLATLDRQTDLHAVQLDLPDLPLVIADRGRLIFALQQVLDNAFKFSEPGSRISISLNRETGDRITIQICDAGCGISPDLLPRVFDQWYQVDPDQTGQVPGFGLGLFCAREIIRQHDGVISVASQPGQGTTVAITLPCTQLQSSLVGLPVVLGGYSMCEIMCEGAFLLSI